MTCDLAKLIDDKTFTFTESDIKFVFHQILTGFSILHSNYIIHRVTFLRDQKIMEKGYQTKQYHGQH
jgi:hypothetical protein